MACNAKLALPSTPCLTDVAGHPSLARTAKNPNETFVAERRSAPSGLFRNNKWFPTDVDRRCYFEKDQAVRAKVEDGRAINVHGFTVYTPELLRHSIKGDILPNRVMNRSMRDAFGGMRKMAFGYDLQDTLVFIGPTNAVIEATLQKSRNDQVKRGVSKESMVPHIGADEWREMVAFLLSLLAADPHISSWWSSNASLDGDDAPWVYQGRLDDEALSAPTVASTLGNTEITAITNKLSWYLRPGIFMGPEPKRFALTNGCTFYAKETPCTGDNERWTMHSWHHFVGDTTNLSYEEEVRLLDLQELFVGYLAVLSRDGTTYYQATRKEVDKELAKKELDLNILDLIPEPAVPRRGHAAVPRREHVVPRRVWRRCVNERARTLESKKKKRKASTATVERKKCRTEL